MHLAHRLLDRQADGTGPFESHYEEVCYRYSTRNSEASATALKMTSGNVF